MTELMQHTNRDPLKSTEALSSILETVINLARQLGATDAAVSTSHDVGYSIDVRMGEVETLAFSDQQEIAVTVYQGHRKGSASSSDLSIHALKSMVESAVEIAKVSAQDPCFGLPEQDLIVLEYPELDLYHPWEMTPSEAIQYAKACEAHALSLDKRITNSDGVGIANYACHYGYANTRGFLGLVKSTRHSISASLVASVSDKMQRDYEYTAARNATQLMGSHELAERVVANTVNRLGAKPIETQTTPVIFHSRVSNSLISSFIQAISGTQLYRKNTFLLDSIGEQVFPNFIHIHEEPHVLGALGSSPFDGDGLVTRPNIFVKNGCVNQYVLSCYTARKLGLATTANAGGVNHLKVEPTAGDLASLLKQMGRGLLVTELMGQGVNLVTGDYSRGVSGFWVEDGVIQFPVEEVTIAGNLRDMYQNIVAVGQDINPNYSTRCGSLWIEQMKVAGASL